MELQHFCHLDHPLVFNENERRGMRCFGCNEPVLGPSYSCIKCVDFDHHKSCAELPLGLHHPLHSKHPLILFHESKRYRVDKDFSKCEVCKEYLWEYSYGCFRCNFNIHNRCTSLPLTMESEVHDHPLSRIWKPMKFTCDLCGKEGNVPVLCHPCDFAIHPSCAACLRKVKVLRHSHPLDFFHSLEVLQSDSRFCQLCVRKVDTHYAFYYCSRCDFLAHLNCAMDKENREELKDEESTKSISMQENEDLELDQSVDSKTYKVKNSNVGEDGIKIATIIEHFSHKHDLKLTYKVQNNKICDGCIRPILPPFYSCAKCSFFLHKSCVELPKIKRHPFHPHPLTLSPKSDFWGEYFVCVSCQHCCNGFAYECTECVFYIDVQCSLVSDILTHKVHEHQLFLSTTSYGQSCSNCGSERNQVFRCTTCEFALDFTCVTLPQTAWYNRHEHPFTLCYTAEDDSGEYYCDICEEERDSKHWFYYCADCSYPAHLKCVLGKYQKCKFGGANKFDFHQHPLTFIEEIKDPPPCDQCGKPCEEFIHQCTQCNFNIHGRGLCLVNIEI